MLEIDHIHPVSKGGDNEESNLITSCYDCNRGKSAGLLTDAPKSLHDRAERVEESRSQVKEYEKIIRSARKRVDADVAKIESVFQEIYPEEQFTSQFKMTVKTFLERFTALELVGFMEIALGRMQDSDSTIRYFCGIFKTRLRDSNG